MSDETKFHIDGKSQSIINTNIPPCELNDGFDRSIRPFIDVIDKLRKLNLHCYFKLPSVIVVGDQSSGKSSIIESISGVQLPRGTGIVTRCPLELQLRRCTTDIKWKATLSYRDQVHKTYDPYTIEELIKTAQNEICKGKKDISKDVLTLRIESNSSNFPDLTLIDLPGISRTPVMDQSSDVCERIMEIINEFVENENTIILCIISANLEVAVNESLKIARKVDIYGERTIGVVTKPDLADETHKLDVLKLMTNDIVSLQKGFVMVKCRSSEDLKKGITLSDSKSNEIIFFTNDKYYSKIDPSQLGTINLANKITDELLTLIKKTIPKLKTDTDNLLEKMKNELDQLPTEIPEGTEQKRLYLTNIMFEITKEFEKMLTKGKYLDDELSKVNTYPLLRKQYENFQKKVAEIQHEATKGEFDKDRLKEKIADSRGREFSGFLSFGLFESLISDHVEKYIPVAKELLDEIMEITKKSLMDITMNRLKHLPEVRKDIEILVMDNLAACVKQALESLNSILEEEKRVFTMDKTMSDQMELTFNNKEPLKVHIFDNSLMLHKLLQCYLKIIFNRLCDIIPMAIRRFVHVKMYSVLKESLMEYTTNVDHGSKIKENTELNCRRLQLKDKLERLEQAKEELNLF